MNEEVKKLAVQAGLSWIMQTDFDRANLQDFASSLIKECAQLCIKDYQTPNGYGVTIADQRCSELIKKHFGV